MDAAEFGSVASVLSRLNVSRPKEAISLKEALSGA